MILAIRTDAPDVTLSLVDDGQVIVRDEWRADRQLAHDLLGRLEAMLTAQGAGWNDLSGLVVFRGPGSFTGLRIGITVMNTIAYAQKIPLVGTAGEGWLEQGVRELLAGKNDEIVLPEYGGDAHITKPRK